MEAPEKIYLYPSDRAGEEYDAEWSIIPWGKGCIEYARTDTFIEKAVEYLKEHKEEDVETEDNGIAGWISDRFIEKFKNYLKGG